MSSCTSRWMLAAALATLAVPASLAEPTEKEVQEALKRDFRPRGQAKMDRIEQDAVQRICTQTRDQPPAALAKAMEADQLKQIAFPQGPLIGNWKNGQSIAESGRGMQWSENPAKPAGGSCYNCHELSPAQPNHGTIGPSLKGFGKVRGYTPEIQKYAYGKIYNAKAYNLCSSMPRFGHSGTLTEQQIKDLVAYLMDPASPVNK